MSSAKVVSKFAERTHGPQQVRKSVGVSVVAHRVGTYHRQPRYHHGGFRLVAGDGDVGPRGTIRLTTTAQEAGLGAVLFAGHLRTGGPRREGAQVSEGACGRQESGGRGEWHGANGRTATSSNAEGRVHPRPQEPGTSACTGSELEGPRDKLGQGPRPGKLGHQAGQGVRAEGGAGRAQPRQGRRALPADVRGRGEAR